MTTALDHATLKERHRRERDGHPPNLTLRVHRALSWLHRAEQCGDDLDARFVFLWIAFNAAYATDIGEQYRASEQETFRGFIRKLLALDTRGRFEQLAWTEFPSSIRVLLDNPYVFADFWRFHRGEIAEAEWKRCFAAAKTAAASALARRDTETVLAIALSRAYTLRNQLVHGGATWNSSVNRDQLRDCTKLLGQLVPLIIDVMLDGANTVWGEPVYPVVER